MLLPFGGKVPRDEGAVFVAPNATVLGDVVLGPGSSVWYGAVLRGDDGTPGASLSKEDVKALFSKADEHMYQQKQIFHQDLDK